MLFLFLFLFEPCAASVFQIFFRTQMLSQRLLVGAVRTAMARHGVRALKPSAVTTTASLMPTMQFRVPSAAMSSWAERVRQMFKPLDINKIYNEEQQKQQSPNSPPPSSPNGPDENAPKATSAVDAVPKETVESLYEAGQYEKAIALFNEQTRVSEGAVKAYLRSLAATQQMHHLNVANLIALLLGPEVVTIGRPANAAQQGAAAPPLNGAWSAESPLPVKIYQSAFSTVLRSPRHCGDDRSDLLPLLLQQGRQRRRRRRHSLAGAQGHAQEGRERQCQV
jgi:hypothetical protein